MDHILYRVGRVLYSLLILGLVLFLAAIVLAIIGIWLGGDEARQTAVATPTRVPAATATPAVALVAGSSDVSRLEAHIAELEQRIQSLEMRVDELEGRSPGTGMTHQDDLEWRVQQLEFDVCNLKRATYIVAPPSC